MIPDVVLHSEYEIIDLYTVQNDKEKTVPFVHDVGIVGIQGDVFMVKGFFDDGAMVAAMSTETFHIRKLVSS
ncbi:hypothetical protein VKT23_017507 [Stygiomarasmius scandens]|uniref:Uncharacterized protein n=1 Tax=Marasmiellus scandens TaxID=2682957 RepID=A0ABR1IS08_9AGAR